MQPNVVAAQAETLRQWSDDWRREATVTQGSAAEGVAEALLRCSDLMLRAAGHVVPYAESAVLLPEPPHVAEVRPD